MVKPPCSGKSSSLLATLLAVVATIALSACGPQTTTTSQAPANPSAPAASSAPKSATPNSFDDVTAQLDPGGDLYLYLSTAQFLGHIDKGVDIIHDLVLSASNTETMSPDARAQAEKAFAVLKDAIDKSGIQDLTGFGASSFALQPGFFRNKMFLHHYPDNGSGLLWNLYGKDPHPFSGLDFMPADTALGSVGDFDLPLLINFLRTEAGQFPDAQQTITQWQTQFAGVTGLQLDDVLNSLNGSMGIVLTLDATSTVTIPIQASSATIPTPRLALLIAVKNDLVFKQIDKMAGSNPGVIKVDEPGLSMRTMPVPVPIEGLNLRPTVAQWNGYLVIASDDKLIRDMIAVQKGGPGLKSTPEFATLSAGMPDQGNKFAFMGPQFTSVVKSIQTQIMANQPGANAAQVAAMQQIIASYQKDTQLYAVVTRLPNGILYVGQGNQGSSQILAPMAMIPAVAAVTAATALPAFEGAQSRAKEIRSLSAAKQIGLACKRYASDNNGAFPPSLDALFPTYLTDHSALVSPFMLSDPAGYTYTPPAANLSPADAPTTVIIEDKYAPTKGIRIVVYADDSARIIKQP